MRRAVLEVTDGYDGDVLFENLELIRTVTAGGGHVVDEPALFIRRRPSTFTRFLEQRPRQAYDDWAEPLRFAFSLAVGSRHRDRGPASTPRSRPRRRSRGPRRGARPHPQPRS